MEKITLTRQDAQRLEGLLQSVVRAFHQIIEARSYTGLDRQIMNELDYDLHEMLVYEKAFELEQSLPPEDHD